MLAVFVIIIALLSLLALVTLHEFSHFIMAKKFGVRVDEFGIGIPPRIFGKKIGETIYSLNLLPLGAFVKVYGEESGLDIEHSGSFAGKPIWQRALIVVAGVVSFWIIAAIILTILAGSWGLPAQISDEDTQNFKAARVQIFEIAPDSPAKEIGLKGGDTIIKLAAPDYNIEPTKVAEVQEFVSLHKGQEITMVIQRGGEVLEKKVIPRTSYPQEQGSIGIGLARTALKVYPWYRAPVEGIKTTFFLTENIVLGWIMELKSVLGIEKLPEGVQMEFRGTLGILDLLREYFSLGINYFLYIIALISVAVALFNILPIPALDGGKLVFLAIEAIRGKPINAKLEQRITAAIFLSLIILMLFVTIKFDIPRLFKIK